MARSGSLPKTFAYIHPRTKTPIHYVAAILVITAIYGLGVSIWIGADNIWYQEGYISSRCSRSCTSWETSAW